jgi:hypothetical protein
MMLSCYLAFTSCTDWCVIDISVYCLSSSFVNITLGLVKDDTICQFA